MEENLFEFIFFVTQKSGLQLFLLKQWVLRLLPQSDGWNYKEKLWKHYFSTARKFFLPQMALRLFLNLLQLPHPLKTSVVHQLKVQFTWSGTCPVWCIPIYLRITSSITIPKIQGVSIYHVAYRCLPSRFDKGNIASITILSHKANELGMNEILNSFPTTRIWNNEVKTYAEHVISGPLSRTFNKECFIACGNHSQ